MVVTKQHAKVGTTEYRTAILVDVPEDYPAVVDQKDFPTRCHAHTWCEQQMLAGRATIAEVYL